MIAQKEIKHKAGLNLVDAQRLETLRFSLTQCLERKVKNKHRYLAHCFYEQGSKGGKLLARQLKKQQDWRHVHNLTVNNKQIVDTRNIAAEFQRFYKSLYNIDSTSTGAVNRGLVNRIQEYLKARELSAMPTTALEEIERPISVELGKVIMALPMGRSPGPDGFTNTYYKKFDNSATFSV